MQSYLDRKIELIFKPIIKDRDGIYKIGLPAESNHQI